MKLRTRRLLALLICVTCLGAMAFTFWWFDLRVSLPTPRPAGLVIPSRGARVAVPEALQALSVPGAPLLVHFYNPHCPCSRFNQEHLAQLFARWGTQVRFVVVAETEEPEVTSPLPASVPLLPDPQGVLAAALGVYSTPQAVLLDGAGQLVYLGNYNTSRYCADPKTEFVRLALEGLSAGGAPLPELPAWGCELPAGLAHARSPR